LGIGRRGRSDLLKPKKNATVKNNNELASNQNRNQSNTLKKREIDFFDTRNRKEGVKPKGKSQNLVKTYV
jgi:hypothetical protein